MKKTIVFILLFVFILGTVLYSLRTEETPVYYLEYDVGFGKNIITTTNNKGFFYILDKPIKSSVSFGEIEIYSCYYDGYSLNLCMYIETEDNDILDMKANDKNLSIYPVVKINNSIIDLSSYGYSISNKQLNSLGTCYKLQSSYNCSVKSIKTPIQIIFDGLEINIPLIMVKGYLQDSEEGSELMDKYN